MRCEYHQLLKKRLAQQAAITCQLQRLNCLHWNSAISLWLTNFDGLEQFYEDPSEKSPTEQVLDALVAVPITPTLTDSFLADLLAHLDFLKLRIKHPETHERWNSLTQSLDDFLGHINAPIAYMWDSSWPESEEIKIWLTGLIKINSLNAN